MDTYAVIDLGTNTFHLLVARKEENGWLLLFRERQFVKLAEDGIHHIGREAFERGLSAMLQFKQHLSKFPDVQVKAFGTAALRKADNADQFIRVACEQSGIPVEVISGQREAGLIFRGVKQLIPFREKPYLIMDIGGGSIEWIIADKNEVKWAESFELGAAVLRNEFHKNDPILPEEVRQIRAHINEITPSFQKALKTWHPVRLVGASGTFDVLASMVLDDDQLPAASIFRAQDVYQILQKIIRLNLEERQQIKHLPVYRADLIVVALLLVEFVLVHSDIDEILYSSYAMKEGILEEMMHDLG